MGLLLIFAALPLGVTGEHAFALRSVPWYLIAHGFAFIPWGKDEPLKSYHVQSFSYANFSSWLILLEEPCPRSTED